MSRDRTEAVAALLREAGAAHAVYEERELGGVYDERWPEWYAAYLVEHGLGDLLGRPISAGKLGDLLAAADAAYKQAQPDEHWTTFYARRLSAGGAGDEGSEGEVRA